MLQDKLHGFCWPFCPAFMHSLVATRNSKLTTPGPCNLTTSLNTLIRTQSFGKWVKVIGISAIEWFECCARWNLKRLTKESDKDLGFIIRFLYKLYDFNRLCIRFCNSIWTLIAKETKQFLKFVWDKQSSFIENVPFLLNSGRVEVNLRCRD